MFLSLRKIKDMSVRNLEPSALWSHFADLNAVPRPSKKEEKVIQFAVDFGKSLGLETFTDAIGNVIIKKPATPGMENRKTLVLQSHLDMVHQKNAETVFDFENEGIKMLVDGDWLTADGTTLGADNGIGVATIMALLSSKDISHPALEALFTIDEETGMTGAFELDTTILKGDILLNLDTEDDDEFSIGCAGGIDTNTSYSYTTESGINKGSVYKVSITGLKGGHSGMDIHLGRGNANKLMARLLLNLEQCGLKLIEFDGGSLRNAIPREAFVIAELCNDCLEKMDEKKAAIETEFSTPEPSLRINWEKFVYEGDDQFVSKEDTSKILNTINAVYNGVFRMSPDIEDLVETSSSLARVIVKDGKFQTQSLQRSSSETSKMDIAHTVASPFYLMGAQVEHTGSYPGWQPNTNSEILNLMVPMYKEMFNEDPRVQACHAGLECGILGEKYPNWDMISFGPTIRNPHSPDEKVHIGSVQKFWKFFLEVVKNTPKK